MILLLACARPYVIEVSPAVVDFGVVDFAVEMPEDGYPPEPVTITNKGEDVVLGLALASYDVERVCVQGTPSGDLPIPLGDVGPGSFYLLNIAVCGLVAGDLDEEVRTEVVLTTLGDPPSLTIPVTWTPVRDTTTETF